MYADSQLRNRSSGKATGERIGHHSPTDAPGCSHMKGLPADALKQVATYFQALADPTRLQILNLLREGERNVGELAQLCGFSSANVSRHLAFLTQQGLVARESRGTAVYYRIADESVYALCDLVCGNIGRALERTASGRRVFAAAARAPAKTAKAVRR
jgi:DNA-binding transcriptional ArsR family regulator